MVDNTLAIDAGGLAGSLSLAHQKRLKAILLTHAHFDHIRDIPLVALNLFRMNTSVNVYSLPEVRTIIFTHLLNGKVYPMLQELPTKKPTVSFHSLTPLRERKIENYQVLPVPVNHSGNTIGYQIRNDEGKAFFYTADTGPGLADCWQRLSFQLLIIEATLPDSYENYARDTGHLTPKLLLAELIELRKIKKSLPRIVVIHRDPFLEKKVERELAEVSAALDTHLTIAREGVRFVL